MTNHHPWSFPEITPGVLVPLALAIAQSIAGSGSTQGEMAERFGYEINALAGNGSDQFDCAYELICEEAKDVAAFHTLCIRYDVYHHDAESDIYSVRWDEGRNANQEKARLDAEAYASERCEYISTWNLLKKRFAPLPVTHP